MPTLDAGQRFARYRIVRHLGSGSSGESYQAEDTLLSRQVTLKLIHSWSPLPDAARRHFFREMHTMSTLSHPYLAPTLDYGEVHGQLYIARPYISSGSLLGNEGRAWYNPPLEGAQAAHYAHQLAQALHHLHSHGHIHGALTFSNILVLRSPNLDQPADSAPLLLADGWIAHFVRSAGQPRFPLLPIHAAPEQHQGRRITPASDQYALAVLLYFWLAGRLPFTGTPDEIEQCKLTHTIPALFLQNPKTTLEQEEILRRALSVHPQARYPSVLAFTKELLASLATTHTQVPTEVAAQLAVSPTPDALDEQEIAAISESVVPAEHKPELTTNDTIIAVEQDTPQSSEIAAEQDTSAINKGIVATEQEKPPVKQPQPEPVPQTIPDVPLPLPQPEPIPQPEPQPAPAPEPEPQPQPAPEIVPKPEPDIALPVPQPEPQPDIAPKPAPIPTPLPEERPVSPSEKKTAQDTEPLVPSQERRPMRVASLTITAPALKEPRQVILERERTTIGRAGSSTIFLNQDEISRHHAVLLRQGDHYLLSDERSSQGTMLNGEPLAGGQTHELQDGDCIKIGDYILIFHLKAVQGPPAQPVSRQAFYLFP